MLVASLPGGKRDGPMMIRLFAVLLLMPTTLQAQSPDSIALRRHAVESSLLPQIISPGDSGFDLKERMEEHRVPGLSIAVINDGELEWAAGYGLKRLWSSDSVQESTLFQAASISKSLTALTVLSLVEDEVLDLDQDVSEYLRSWTLPEGAQTAEQRVTLRRLLTHSAGINVHGFVGVPVGGRLPTTTELLEGGAGTERIRVVSIPGERFRYSGGGYQIVQLVLEDVSGGPFARLMRSTVLEPLGMEGSTFDQPLPEELVPDAASGHQRSADRKLDTIPGGWYERSAPAAGGLWTKPSDLARFALGIRAAWLEEPGALLGPPMARTMLTPGKGRWGLGIPVSGIGESLSFGHGGNSPGYAAFWVLYPETGDGVVVMANARASGDLLMEVVRAVERVYGWPGDFAPRESLPFERVILRALFWVGALGLAGVAAWRWYARQSLMHRSS